jgi:hypothetical protein
VLPVFLLLLCHLSHSARGEACPLWHQCRFYIINFADPAQCAFGFRFYIHTKFCGILRNFGIRVLQLFGSRRIWYCCQLQTQISQICFVTYSNVKCLKKYIDRQSSVRCGIRADSTYVPNFAGSSEISEFERNFPRDTEEGFGTVLLPPSTTPKITNLFRYNLQDQDDQYFTRNRLHEALNCCLFCCPVFRRLVHDGRQCH